MFRVDDTPQANVNALTLGLGGAVGPNHVCEDMSLSGETNAMETIPHPVMFGPTTPKRTPRTNEDTKIPFSRVETRIRNA